MDRAAVLFVDDDLLELDMTQPPNGEDIAYLARCYSSAGLIVAVNDEGEDPFDLTLRDKPESFADLVIGSKQLECQSLWLDAPDGFAPWYWPVIPTAVGRLERRIASLSGRLDDLVLDVMDITVEHIRGMAQSSLSFLGSHRDVAALTVAEFVADSNSGLRRRDVSAGQDIDARVAAARLAKWLEYQVLPGQDYLVDAPHLVPRIPSLLRGAVEDVSVWNALAVRDKTPETLAATELEAARFLGHDWLSRPAWWWPIIPTLDIEEVRDPFAIRPIPYIFNEDLSAFASEGESRQFICDFPESPFRRRFISDPEALQGALSERVRRVSYAPLNNLVG